VHVRAQLALGATPEELRALLAHAAMFVGFPRALVAARVVAEVLGTSSAGA
jgi:alkylhydroperoxidase/carboxymuconolactone decarboxylase family protein YurZ